MPVVPLGVKAYRRDAAQQHEVELLNMILEKDELGTSPDGYLRLTRPGLAPFTQLPAPARALFCREGVLGGKLYAIAGPSLVEAGGPVIGQLEVGGRAALAAGVGYLFAMAGGKLWSCDGTALAPVEVPDARVVTDLDSIDGFVFVGTEKGRFYWIKPGEKVIDPLDFATAESSPDALVAVKRVGSEVWLFGSATVEPWQPTGDADAPFQRASGRLFERGCLHAATVQRFDNSAVWVGDDAMVYRADAVPLRISTHGIEERIRKATGDLSALVIEADGHKLYVLQLPGQGAWAFDAATGEWSRFQSAGRSEWRPAHSTRDRTGWIVADGTGPALWRLSPDAPDDAGEAFEQAVSGTVAVVGKPGRNDNAAISVGTSAPLVLNVNWRDGGEPWGEPEPIDVQPPLEMATLYRLGRPLQPLRTFRVSTTSRARLRLSAMLVNQAWR